jgi:GTP cyclohydrolase II
MSDWNVHIGDPIRLDTAGGVVELRHLEARSSEETSLREGLVAIGTVAEPTPFPVRVQSSCVFSEALGATDCDCALQLEAAMERIARGGGAVVYLYEEGRGAGLRMKLAAIRVQQLDGIDTAAAFARLGLQPDPRDHGIAAVALRKLLGVRPVRLLTNNPAKTEALRRGGVNVVDEERLIVAPTPEIKEYLREKAKVLRHNLHEH